MIALLKEHPRFYVKQVCAREERVGSECIGIGLLFESIQSVADESLVLSALPNRAAQYIEPMLAEKGCLVISNAQCHRMQEGVPLVLPDVNPEALLDITRGIVCVPNCVVAGLTVALKPLHDHFGIDAVHVTTLQAISGAGYPGVASLDILGNVIPHIQGEEEKIEMEPLKILKTSFPISATAMRVPVKHGHMASVALKLKRSVSLDAIIHAWNSYKGFSQQLFSAPKNPIRYLQGVDDPQPQRHVELDRGMRVSIGRLRKCSNFDCKFILLSHNLIQGAAGTSVLIAEALMSMRREYAENTGQRNESNLTRTHHARLGDLEP
ncbi:MAG: aspartate-semialdehyde dehydrogenase [Simkaniaceae bacterium]|nr:aspartate-semialdehyde dehydrogenase [Simkaniaceae bacterium]MCF7852779.1 aspartate-semialdehyde dehydrogenase [Simkaniaceae bacterium]